MPPEGRLWPSDDDGDDDDDGADDVLAWQAREDQALLHLGVAHTLPPYCSQSWGPCPCELVTYVFNSKCFVVLE